MLLKIPEGNVIVTEGELNMDMYKIVTGTVEIYSGYGTDNETILGIRGKGQYFGEIGLIAQKPSIYTVVAYSDTVLLRITMTELDDYIKHNHHDILEIMQHMAGTIYNLKYSMDMILDDAKTAKEMAGYPMGYKAYIEKQFAKYNVQTTLQSSFSRKA